MGARPGVEARSLTPMAVLVLGLLIERPMHPYEMFQTLVARRDDRFVNLRPGSLYHTVDRLRDRNLLQISDVHRDGNRPERTIYAITDGGRETLDAALATMLRSPAAEYPELYLALAEAHALPRADVVELLGERVAAMRIELEAVESAMDEALSSGHPEMFLLDTGCRRAVLDTQVRWIERLRDRLASGELMWLGEFKELKKSTPPAGRGDGAGQIARSQNEVTT